MKYVIQGQNINHTYKIESNKKEDNTFSNKPKIVLDKTDVNYENILTFETDHLEYNAEYNSSVLFFGCPYININEKEKVAITNQIFRADLNITQLHSNKILSEVDNKSSLESEYKTLLTEYCGYICKKYPKVKRHCEIYNITLPIEEIDEIVKEVEKVNEIEKEKRDFIEGYKFTLGEDYFQNLIDSSNICTSNSNMTTNKISI